MFVKRLEWDLVGGKPKVSCSRNLDEEVKFL